MVRLNDVRIYRWRIYCAVSIPLWCDWMNDEAISEIKERSFNSSMVRLNEKAWTWADGFATMFQFLYGAIECNQKLQDIYKYTSFNSSMVRLNAVSSNILYKSVSFQFLYGAIEWSCWLSRCGKPKSFNSSMVRLNGFFLRHNWYKKFRFNSSMVRLNVSFLRGCPIYYHVSIPLWCDWMCSLITLHQIIIQFQFLYGAIEWKSLDMGRWFCDHVSIPLWCDWMVLTDLPDRTRQGFNSSMVRLNDTYGTLHSLYAYVSIPLWCDWMWFFC